MGKSIQRGRVGLSGPGEGRSGVLKLHTFINDGNFVPKK